MKTRLIVTSLLAVTLAAACGGKRLQQPVIDPAGVDMGRYQNDLAQCEQIAQQVGQKAGAGALGGAVVGALVGSIVGDSRTAMKSAGAGAVVGGARGGGATRDEKSRVVRNCLRQRGYAVLN